MTDEKLLSRLHTAFSEPFTGWDFSSAQADWIESDLPWDYRRLVQERLPGRESLLDMNTGGGEFLTSLADLPPNVCATESYEPNIPLARKRLESHGYRLQAVRNPEDLPFDKASFDIVLNRHGSFEPQGVARCLRPGGVFLTQQVGGLNAADLNQALGAPAMDDTNWCMAEALPLITAAGMTILDAAQHMGFYRFASIEAVVYYLKAIPWQIPGFRPDDYQDQLAILENQIARDGHLDIISQRFLIVATKPR